MIILIDIDNVDTSNIYFGSRLVNKIKNMKWFQRIGYSTKDFDVQGLYIHVPIKACIYKSRIKQVYDIEHKILTSINPGNLHPLFSLRNEMEHKYNNKIICWEEMIIKISGVWENDTHYGIIFKIN
jgi:hypothetical protein